MVTGFLRRTRALFAVTAVALALLPNAAAAADQDAAVAQRYVALGDSYSSGESVKPYDPATNTNNRCHRSANAYPNQLADENPLDIDLVAFRACSGAETPDVTQVAQYPTQPAQVSGFPASVDLVSITIGGNDIGLADFAEACVLRTACGGSGMVNGTSARSVRVVAARI